MVLAGVMVLSLHAFAQAQVSLNINIGRQPAWGPTGYNHVDYYYLPDIESYYDVATGQYIYQDGGQWIFANSLPPRYRGYDLYSGYKVVVNRPKPYLNFSRDRVAYGRYRNWSGAHQPMLRESRTVINRTNNVTINRTNNVNINRRGNNGGGYNHPGGNQNQGNPNQGRPQGQFNGGGHDNHGQGDGRQGGYGGGHDDHGQGRQGGYDGGHDDRGHH